MYSTKSGKLKPEHGSAKTTKKMRSSASQPLLEGDKSQSPTQYSNIYYKKSGKKKSKFVYSTQNDQTKEVENEPLQPNQSIKGQKTSAEQRLKTLKRTLSKSRTMSSLDNNRYLKHRYGSQTLQNPEMAFKPIATIDKLYNFKLKKLNQMTLDNAKIELEQEHYRKE